MFSNRRWWLKVLVPLAVFAVLCADAGWRLGAKYPHFSTALAKADEYDGKDIWVSPSRIVETPRGALVVEGRQARLTLLTEQTFKKDSHVIARGTFHRNGTLTVKDIHASSHWVEQRSGIYGISALVLLFYLGTFFNKFRLTMKGWEPREPIGGAKPPVEPPPEPKEPPKEPANG